MVQRSGETRAAGLLLGWEKQVAGFPIPSLGIAIPISGSAKPKAGMAIPAIGIAIPASDFPKPKAGIAIPRPGNAIPTASAARGIACLPRRGSYPRPQHHPHIMASSPQDFADKLNRLLTAWKKNAATKSYGGHTLEEFTELTAPSLIKRARLDALDEERKEVANEREDADVVSEPLVKKAVDGIGGDPDFGKDSTFWEELGFVRDSERASGLTRKKKAAAAAKPDTGKA